jgi:hypothetical protein
LYKTRKVWTIPKFLTFISMLLIVSNLSFCHLSLWKSWPPQLIYIIDLLLFVYLWWPYLPLPCLPISLLSPTHLHGHSKGTC